MHTLLGKGGGQRLIEGVDCLVALLAAGCITAGDVSAGCADVVWLWRDGFVDLRGTLVSLGEGASLLGPETTAGLWSTAETICEEGLTVDGLLQRRSGCTSAAALG